MLADEVEVGQAEDLGKIDTFRFEEDKVLKAALAALGRGDWDRPPRGRRARARRAGASFWLRDDPARQSAWQLVARRRPARAGDRRPAGDSLDARGDMERAVERYYVERGAAVDQAHRHLEQRRAALLYPQLPGFETLRARLDRMRPLWRDWADRWAVRLQRALQGARVPAGRRAPAADDLRRGREAAAQEAGTTASSSSTPFATRWARSSIATLADTPATTVQL